MLQETVLLIDFLEERDAGLWAIHGCWHIDGVPVDDAVRVGNNHVLLCQHSGQRDALQVKGLLNLWFWELLVRNVVFVGLGEHRIDLVQLLRVCAKVHAAEGIPLERRHLHFLQIVIRTDRNVGDVEVSLLKSKSIDELVSLAIFTFVFHVSLLFDDLEGGQ